MKGPLSLKLGGIAALYLFWLVCWLVLDEKAFGPVYYKLGCESDFGSDSHHGLHYCWSND